MPKAARRRAGPHNHAPPVRKRAFAVDDNQVEHVEVGGGVDVPVSELLSPEEQQGSSLTKKEKQEHKRAAFLERLESSHSPYSKSHNRRVKRKAKQEIAGGLGAIQTAIEALDDTQPTAAEEDGDEGSAADGSTTQRSQRSKAPPGKIGEGKAAPLSKAQRKRMLKLEQLRQPQIRSNPQFSTNPFETIRTHAKNTLIVHDRLS
ncbi:hypothetical protein BDN72DRAFT_783667 [Pluteus cervinus]|uniref:Uncharacterized protein n=1 Tax=Pluteus cervinus TaxID=181527 RepID=A0ACD3BH96_9AGAR|nr:hypothetical protein BDN72DRAFT_783667 [Pluteus cervinus]